MSADPAAAPFAGPSADALFAAIDATWPAAGETVLPGWRLRRGDGGGKRVSAASATVADPGLAVLEAGQAALGQPPLVMIRPGEAALDARLDAAGYRIIDPVTIWLAPIEVLAIPPKPVRAFHVDWPPLEAQREIWAEGGIGAARLAVMARVAGPKSAILGRTQDRPAGTAFAAVAGDIAMLHALEVTPTRRRQGAARDIVAGAAIWARARGASWFATLVTVANGPSTALFRGLGMVAVARYHYRGHPATDPGHG